MHGRSTELSALASAFDRLNSNSFEIVFISGNTGTGKSAIIFETYKLVTQKQGILAFGKYDYSRYRPYSAIIQAFDNMCDSILLKDPATISYYSSQIKNEAREGF